MDFFDKPVPAVKARTLDRRPETGLDSFDRFFPNQDTLPKGGFGNLIALPLQKAAREKNHSIFLNDDMVPYTDQWAFLDSIKRVDEYKLDSLIQNAVQRNELLPVVYETIESEDEAKPWERKPVVLPAITEPFPQKVEIVLADQLYIYHTGLPPVLRNRILRLASFANALGHLERFLPIILLSRAFVSQRELFFTLKTHMVPGTFLGAFFVKNTGFDLKIDSSVNYIYSSVLYFGRKELE